MASAIKNTSLKQKIFLLGVVIFVSLTGIALISNTTSASAQSEGGEGLDCLSCHPRTLEYHDELGTGNDACWTCHDNIDMTKLRLADGSLLPDGETNQLCGQCHHEKYENWQDGTHGFPGMVALGECISCHNPHKPQMAFIDITEPHPEPAPSASDLPVDQTMIMAISVVFLTGLGILIKRRRAEP